MTFSLVSIEPPAFITAIEEQYFELPSYKTKGRILVHILGEGETKVYRWESEVLDYDGDSCVFWIQEGVGFDFWLDSCYFAGPGHYVIEGIVGSYIRGDGWMTDDDEDWEYDLIRPATQSEIESMVLV